MKVLKMLFCLSALFVTTSTVSIKAHPGRTDGNGCHVCRTNCADWGLQQDEYHCHNGGGSSSSGAAPATPTPAPVAPVVEVYTPPIIDYKAQGQSDGYAFKKGNPNAELNEASYSYDDATYKEEYKSAFERAARELNDSSINRANEKGRADALLYATYNFDNEPTDIVKSVYEENYKVEFDKATSGIKSELAKVADENAYIKIYDDADAKEVKDHGLENYKEYYKKEYTSRIKKYEKERNNWIKKAKEQAKIDKENGDNKSYEFMNEMADTKFSDELKKAYDESYESSESVTESNPLIPSAIITFIVVGSFVIAVKRQK